MGRTLAGSKKWAELSYPAVMVPTTLSTLVLFLLFGSIASDVVQKRFNNDFYGLLNKYQSQQ
ncbi:hypothetical protein Y032_0001g1, partial [Ancylostoma ceylanicum]